MLIFDFGNLLPLMFMNKPETFVLILLFKNIVRVHRAQWCRFLMTWTTRMNSLTLRGSHVAVSPSAGPPLVWQSLSRWTWWRGSWGGRGRRSAARRTTHWAWCTSAGSSPSCAIRLATWPRRSRRRSSTWCCPYLTGWVTHGVTGPCASWSLQLFVRPRTAIRS